MSSATHNYSCCEKDGSPSASMTVCGESLREATHSKNTLFSTKELKRIATWNVRTLNTCGNLAQVIKEMDNYRIDVLGVSETHWTGNGKFHSNNHTVIYSGNTRARMYGTGLILNEKAS